MLRPVLTPPKQRFASHLVDRHQPSFARLGISRTQAKRVGFQIDPRPLQAQQLTTAATGHHGDGDQIGQVGRAFLTGSSCD
jgi:hypothetical protein